MGGSSNKKSGLQLTPRQLLLISFPGSGESDDWMNKVHRLALDQLFYLSARKEKPEKEFLDINVTKDCESFASCYLQYLLPADFKEHQTLHRFSRSLQKIRETIKLESVHEGHFVERKNEDRKLDRN